MADSIRLEGGEEKLPKTQNDIKVYASDMPRLQLFLLLLGLGISSFLYALDQTIVATAQPKIAAEFNSFELIAWITTPYLLTSTSIQPLYGKLSDIFGRKIVMLWCVWVFVIGSVICAAAPTMLTLILGRTIAGIGGGGLLSVTIIILADITTERERPTYMNLINIVFVVTDGLGPFIGGVFSDAVSWRWCFWINLITLPFVTFTLVRYLHLPIPGGSLQEKIKRIDFLGMISMVVFLVTFLLAMTWGGTEFAWNSGVVVGLLVATVVGIVIFILVEHYFATEPLLPLRLLRWKYRNFPIIMVTRCTLFFSLFGVVFYIPLFFQLARNTSAIISGVHLFPFLFGAFIFSTLATFIVKRTGSYRSLCIIGMGVLAISMGLTSTLSRSSSLGQEIGYLLIGGAGLGFAVQTQLIAVQAGVDDKDVGTVTAVATTMANLGGCICLPLIGSITNNAFQNHIIQQMPGFQVTMNDLNPEALAHLSQDQREIIINAYVEAIQLAFRVLAGITVFGFLVICGLKHVPLRGNKPENVEVETEKPQHSHSEVTINTPS
ncbi:uncharacterized protein VTP21DRAFT_6165 [Calcarisporiella thermophila]|uniref:uncharacterized protein n=1 Tax=Calcarisporiella thermophila TaxID=911321 RepID=UPI0037440E42